MTASTDQDAVHIFAPDAFEQAALGLCTMMGSAYLARQGWIPFWIPLPTMLFVIWAFISRPGGTRESLARRADWLLVHRRLRELLDGHGVDGNCIRRLRELSLEIESSDDPWHPFLTRGLMGEKLRHIRQRHGAGDARSGMVPAYYREAISELMTEALGRYRILSFTPGRITLSREVSFHFTSAPSLSPAEDFDHRPLITYLRHPPPLRY